MKSFFKYATAVGIKSFFNDASKLTRVLSLLVFSTIISLGQYLVVAPKPALAAGPRVTICHRTKSASNPYRLITVSGSSVNSGHSKPSHSGPVFGTDSTSDGNGETWGDIIPGSDDDGDRFWSDGSGSGAGDNWSGGLTTGGKSFMMAGGANVSRCSRMTAARFVEISRAAGVSDSDIAADLNDQDANEDALLGTFTAAGLDAQVSKISVTTNAASSIGATSATLNGTVSNSTGSNVKPNFQYGTSATLETFTQTNSTTESSSNSLSPSISVTGLTANTTYYYRAMIETGSEDTLGTVFGAILSFTTTSRTLTIDAASYAASYSFTATPPTITSTVTTGGGAKSYSSSTTDVCTIDATSGLVVFVSSGTCAIGAQIALDGSDPATSAAEISFTVTAANRTLTIDAPSYAATYSGDASPPTITSTASAGAGTKSYSSSSTSVCTINSSTGVVTFRSAGTCLIAATIAANGGYNSATATQISFEITSNPTTTTTTAAASSSPQVTTPTTISPATTAVTTTTAVARISNVILSGRKISICHATSSATNPYVLITVDRNSLNGHGDHSGDIIPAPAGGCPTTLISQIATTSTSAPAGKVTICHATAAGTYVQITVDRNGLNGHGDHLDDLILAPSGGCPYSIRQYALQLANTTTSVAPGTGSVITAPRTPAGKITICHATAAGFYVELTVDRNGLNGHDDHDGDIVPAPAGGCPIGVSRQSSPTSTTTLPDGKISICHATAAGIYVSLTVDRNGLNGHDRHEGDIIPAPTGGCPSRVSAQSSSSTLPRVPAGKIGICHATNRGTFEYKVVDADDLDGHDEHEQDIIPAPIGGCTSPSSTVDLPETIACINAREIAKLDESNSSLTDGVKVEATQSSTDDDSGTIEISNPSSGPALSLVGVESVDPNIEITVKSSGVDYNKPVTWVNEGYGTYCWKIEPFGDRDYIYTLPNPPAPPDARYAGLAYSTVIVKAGSLTTTDPNYQVNTLFDSPAAGSGVFADVNKNGVSDPGGQGGGTIGDKSISHVVLCVGSQSVIEKTPTTTLPTSSTVGALQTTTTTINWSADFCPEPTTTTSIADSASSSTTTFTTTTSTTTTIAGGSTTSSTTTTIAGGSTSTSTTIAGGSTSTSTTIAGDSTTSTTASPSTTLVTTTTSPGGPEDPNPPIEFFVKAMKTPSSGVTDLVLTLSDGVTSEVVFLKLNVKNFSVVATSLPATGQERWSTEQQLGWLLFITGALLGIIEIRRRETLRR